MSDSELLSPHHQSDQDNALDMMLDHPGDVPGDSIHMHNIDMDLHGHDIQSQANSGGTDVDNGHVPHSKRPSALDLALGIPDAPDSNSEIDPGLFDPDLGFSHPGDHDDPTNFAQISEKSDHDGLFSELASRESFSKPSPRGNNANSTPADAIGDAYIYNLNSSNEEDKNAFEKSDNIESARISPLELDNRFGKDGDFEEQDQTRDKSDASLKQEPYFEEPAVKEEPMDDLAPIDLNADDHARIRQSHAIVIPSYASWFNMKKIHLIERESLPEFFKSSHPSKSPKIYANYRNFMVNAYRLNPNEFLTLTSCRRTLVGDVGTLMRVHRFLNKWGLINYQVNPLFKPAYALEKLPNGSQVGLPYCGDFHVLYDTPRGLFPFNTYKPLELAVNVDRLKQLVGSPGESKGVTEENDSQSKRRKIDAAPDQSAQEKKSASGWTAKQLSSLLSAIKTHRNDWYAIAKAVGSNKTPQECILKFLGLPIEDEYSRLDDRDAGILKYASNFPVIGVDNPVISNLIFMMNLVDPEVIKAATSKASKVMDDLMLQRLKQHEETAGKANGQKDGTEGDHDDDKLDQPPSEEHRTEASDPAQTIQEASAAILGSVGARSHLFANYEEREMLALSNTIINQHLKKFEVKVEKMTELEKVYQRERRNLAEQQSAVFIDRLELTKSTVAITKKLREAVKLLKGSNENEDDSPQANSISTILEDIDVLLTKPISASLVAEDESKAAEAVTAASEDDNSAVDANRPLSVVEPQNFKVWAP